MWLVVRDTPIIQQHQCHSSFELQRPVGIVTALVTTRLKVDKSPEPVHQHSYPSKPKRSYAHITVWQQK